MAGAKKPAITGQMRVFKMKTSYVNCYNECADHAVWEGSCDGIGTGTGE